MYGYLSFWFVFSTISFCKYHRTVNAHITLPHNDTNMDVNHDKDMLTKKEVGVNQGYHLIRSSTNRRMSSSDGGRSLDPPGYVGKKNPLYQSIPIPTSNGPPLVSRRRRVSKDSLNASSSSLSSLDSSLHDMEIVVLSLAKDVQKSNKQVGLLLKQMQTLEQEQKKINDRTRRSSTPDSLDVYRKEWESEMEKLDQSFRSSCSSKSNKQRVSFSSLDDSMSSSSRTMPSMLLDESIGSNHSSRRKSIDTQNPSMLDQLISNDKKKDRRRRFGRK